MVTPDRTVWRCETWTMVHILGSDEAHHLYGLAGNILAHVEDPFLNLCLLPCVRQSQRSQTIIVLEETGPLCLRKHSYR
jgi:hypothetical protein